MHFHSSGVRASGAWCAGRKHQLRLHCAGHLGAPIVGDDRHGATRTPAQRGNSCIRRYKLPQHCRALCSTCLDEQPFRARLAVMRRGIIPCV